MSATARLGAFVFSAFLILMTGVFLIGEKQFLFSPTYHLKAVFDNVAGLDEGAPVRAGGVRIGAVEQILLPQQPGEKLRIDMKLEDSTRRIIRKNSIVTIETEGMLGSKYVAISFGTAQGELVHDGDMIQSRPPLEFADMAQKASLTLETAREAIDSSKIAIGHLNEATADMKSITGKINRGQGTIGALVNDQTTYRNLNATTVSLREMVGEARTGIVSFQENMEALKHNWFLRGFFNDRGYFDSSELTEHAIAGLPEQTPLKHFVFQGRDLFDKPDSAKLRKEKLLNPAGAFLESNPFGLAVVVAYTGELGDAEDNLTLSRARATIVRQYLTEKFKMDDKRIRTLGLGEATQPGADKGGRLEIVVYQGEAEMRTTEPKNK